MGQTEENQSRQVNSAANFLLYGRVFSIWKPISRDTEKVEKASKTKVKSGALEAHGEETQF